MSDRRWRNTKAGRLFLRRRAAMRKPEYSRADSLSDYGLVGAAAGSSMAHAGEQRLTFRQKVRRLFGF